MIEPARLHADLIAYCAGIGVSPTTFGQGVVRDFAFAASLQSGAAKVGKVALAQRFMREHPEVPRRQFGAVAKAWRERVAADAAGDAGGCVEGGHQGAPCGGAPAGAAETGGSFTDATLDHVVGLHNQESQSGRTAR